MIGFGVDEIIMKKLIIIISLLATGCAGSPFHKDSVFRGGTPPARTVNYAPVIDPSQCQDCDYTKDITECQAIAAQNSSVGRGALTGAAATAGIFALTGALLGVHGIGQMAMLGGGIGAAGGAGNEVNAAHLIVQRCMTNRGWSVLR